MSNIVTKESLNTLAVTAFAEILCKDNGKMADFDDETPSNAMYHLLRHVFPERMDTEEHPSISSAAVTSGFQEGTELGLAAAAAIVTHGLDHAGRSRGC